MRSERRTDDDRSMCGAGMQRVVLELEPGEPISGQIRIATGPAQAFCGWLELATKLEQARAGEGDKTTIREER